MNDEDLFKLINKCMLHNLGMLSFVQLLAKEYKRKNPHFDDEEFYKEIGIDCNTLSPVDKKN